MFLFAYIGALFSAILLWFITIRVTKDEEGLDWWDCLRWVGGAYFAAFIIGLLAHALQLPEGLTLVLQILVGLAVLDWFLRGQFGAKQANEILVLYVSVRVLFALPWVIMWFLSLSDTNP